MSSGLTFVDGAVIAGYFALIVSFGATFGRFTRSTRDFFLAGQRFPFWLVAFSCVATVVGSYSFVKYSAAGFSYGVASSQTYLNDWFWMPLFLFGWYPILYYSRVLSVPEYFRRRFDTRTGLAANGVLLLYLVGYIGINLFTIGKALESLFRVDLFLMALLVTALCMVYEWTGGQTSVIVTDLFQGVLLLIAGLVLFFLGLYALGGISSFADALPAGHLRPLPEPAASAKFNFVGIFWQDGLAGGVAFYFMNQGMLMRFLSARSVAHGRRAAGLVLVVLMPLAAIAVSGAGWIGAAMRNRGMLAETTAADEVFVRVADLLTGPGVFGLVMAALLAALMSTADTLINASSALLVNDIYRPYVRPGRDERHYLAAARWTSLLAAGAGLALVPLYRSFGTIYEAHGAFTAAVTPPMAVALLLAFLWPRYTASAAFATLTLGTLAMFASIRFPELVSPFSHGIPPDGGYKYIRALYGVVVSGAVGVVVTAFTRPREAESIRGLTVWSLASARRDMVGPRAAKRSRSRVMLVRAIETATDDESGDVPAWVDARTVESTGWAPGGLLFVDDRRRWLAGLRSVRCRLQPLSDSAQENRIVLPRAALDANGWKDGDRVRVEPIE